MRCLPIVCLALCALSLTACGTITGIPSHGGGKRYAVEQELVAASARASAKNLKLNALKGRKVAIRFAMMGDKGAGNLVGGRYSIISNLRGDYINTPRTVTNSELPVVSATTTTTSGGTTTTTVSENPLNAPSRSVTEQEGANTNIGAGISYAGQGSFNNETLVQNDDTKFLLGVLEKVFFLRDITIVPEAQADTLLLISVDVFGTVRSRNDWHLLNQERLLAKTAMEIFAIDIATGRLIIKPTTSSYEAEYIEQYALWAGPINKIKTVKTSSPLLVDFSDMTEESDNSQSEGINAPLSFKKSKLHTAKKDAELPISNEVINRRRGQ